MPEGSQKEQIAWGQRIRAYIDQFITTGLLHRDAYEFLREYRPWEGLRRYGWTMRFLILVAIGVGLYIFYGFFEMMAEAISDPEAFQAGVMGAFSQFSLDSLNWMWQGTTKYLVLIILEILTFHIVQRTLEIQIGREPDHSFRAFMDAEIRMIGVAFLSWVLETITQILVNIPLGILGLDFLKDPSGFLIEFYFLGFAFIDNYHECFGLKIGESRKRTWLVAGIAVATGMTAYVLMFVPVVGVVAASMLGAVVAAKAMELYHPVTKEEMAFYEAQREKEEA